MEHTPSPRTKESFTVVSVVAATQTILDQESLVEAKIGKVFEARNDIMDIRCQWPRVKYVCDDGTEGHHVFDFHITLRSGKRILVAAKPSDKVQSTGLEQTIKLIKAQRKEMARYGDDAIILTEQYYANGRYENAANIVRARRMKCQDEIDNARAAVDQLWGAVRLYDLLKNLPIKAHRRSALWCLIGEGYLLPTIPGRITDETYLQLAQRQQLAA